TLQERYKDPGVERELTDGGIDSVDALLGREVWFTPAIARGLPTHTLDFPKLSYRPGKDFFMGKITSISELIDNEVRRTLTRARYNSLLFTEWNKEFRKHEPDLNELAQDFCQTKELRFYPDWDKESYQCKSAMVGLVAEGKLNPYQYLLPERVKVL